MFLKKKNRFKPLYKQFINLYENVQNRQKILQFKKQKWNKFISYLKYKSKKYKKFKPYNQNQYLVSRYPNKWNSYKKGTYKNILQTYKKFKLLYGDLGKKKIKNYIIKSLKIKNKKTVLISYFLNLFESRLDIALYKAKFSLSVRSARQLISHGKILVNYNKVTNPSYNLKTGDLISINPKFKFLIEMSIANSSIWPIPPKHLSINYKTFQIIFGTFTNENISTQFNFNLNLEKLLIDLT
jgi:small subunit ribosomal protein S4